MDLMQRLQLLHKVLAKIVDLPELEWHYFADRIKPRDFDKGDLLVSTGAPASEFFFLASGLVRLFYTTDEGKEFNKSFCLANDFVGAYSAAALNLPSRFSIQALEPTQTLLIPAVLLNELFERHHAWERLGRKLAENLAIKKEFREAALLLDAAETRYQNFLEEYPGLYQRIPQYHIASYLGITDVALSRIRKRLRAD